MPSPPWGSRPQVRCPEDQVGGEAAQGRASKAAPTVVQSPDKEARAYANKVVDRERPNFNHRPCICHDARFGAALGEMSLRVQVADKKAYPAAVCWVKGASLETGDPDWVACSQFETLDFPATD